MSGTKTVQNTYPGTLLLLRPLALPEKNTIATSTSIVVASAGLGSSAFVPQQSESGIDPAVPSRCGESRSHLYIELQQQAEFYNRSPRDCEGGKQPQQQIKASLRPSPHHAAVYSRFPGYCLAHLMGRVRLASAVMCYVPLTPVRMRNMSFRFHFRFRNRFSICEFARNLAA